MFSYEERRKAVELLIQYDGRYAAVIHELGYPSREALRKWYYEYRENGNIHEKHKGGYSTAEKEAAKQKAAALAARKEQKEKEKKAKKDK